MISARSAVCRRSQVLIINKVWLHQYCRPDTSKYVSEDFTILGQNENIGLISDKNSFNSLSLNFEWHTIALSVITCYYLVIFLR